MEKLYYEPQAPIWVSMLIGLGLAVIVILLVNSLGTSSYCPPKESFPNYYDLYCLENAPTDAQITEAATTKIIDIINFFKYVGELIPIWLMWVMVFALILLIGLHQAMTNEEVTKCSKQ